MDARAEEPREELCEVLREALRALHPSEPFSDAAGELGPAERDLVQRVMSDPEICRTRTAAHARVRAYLQAAKQGVVPSIEDMAKALPRTQLECELADARWDEERLERTAARKPTAEEMVERDPELRRWTEYHQAAVEQALDANSTTPRARRRAGEVANRLHVLARDLGLSGDQVHQLQAIEFDEPPSIEDVDAALRHTTPECEAAVAAMAHRQVQRAAARGEAGYRSTAEFAAKHLPAARARLWRAVAALRHSVRRPLRARARSSCSGRRRPGRSVSRSSASSSRGKPRRSDDDPPGEPARRRTDVDVVAARAPA